MAKPEIIAPVKGFRDVLPGESARWGILEDRAAAVFGAYGYGEIRLPVVERAELFERSLGDTTDVVEKEMYSFPDRDGTVVTLRPEATASVVRAFIASGLAQGATTARLFYRGPMFRRERPQRGRYRQFHQIGAELLGCEAPLADAELLVMLVDTLEAVQARGTHLEVNSVGDAQCRPAYRERVREFGMAHRVGLCPDCHRRLERNPLRLLDCKVPTCRDIMARAPVIGQSLCAPCRDHFTAVRRLLDAEQVRYEINPRLVRGLDYYCRTAFEVLADGLGAQNAVGGGGRYDGLAAALGGPDICGLGFALGLERLAMITGADEVTTAPVVVVLPLVEAAASPALTLARRLRGERINVALDPPGRSVKAMMRAADKRGARLALLIGDDELKVGRATIRDLHRRSDIPCHLPLEGTSGELATAVRALIGGST